MAAAMPYVFISSSAFSGVHLAKPPSSSAPIVSIRIGGVKWPWISMRPNLGSSDGDLIGEVACPINAVAAPAGRSALVPTTAADFKKLRREVPAEAPKNPLSYFTYLVLLSLMTTPLRASENIQPLIVCPSSTDSPIMSRVFPETEG